MARDLTTFAYRRIVILLVSLVVVPTFLLLASGVVLLFLGDPRANVLMGILVLALSGAAATGVILVWVFVRREANLSQLQSDFVSKVSHELRTPLTSIRLFSETLAMGRGDAAANAECIRGLQLESARLQELIDRLLDWGRMESGKRKYDMRETDVHSIVEAAVGAAMPFLDRCGATLTRDEPEGLPPVYADRSAISDALLNLLTNAAKYGGTPPRIRVVARHVGPSVRFEVHDNGRGIHAREHRRIFQKFYRVDDRLSRETEGSGVGLAIVNLVVKAHRGKVLLNSEPGGGSCFTIVLPVRQAHG